MVSRISGIVGGTLISLLVAITIYPSSATQELLEDLKEALRGLCELGNAAIQEAAIALGHVSPPDDGACASGLPQMAALLAHAACTGVTELGDVPRS